MLFWDRVIARVGGREQLGGEVASSKLVIGLAGRGSRRRGGGRHWAVGTDDGFWEAGIIRDEGDGNLRGERKGAGGEDVFATNALSDEDWSMSCLETGWKRSRR
ncbi:hypothetical protein KY285_022268 [Solanum tuberosum]|nr:hypothetical protein KY285_022268 [Solanum tuberosum]